MARGFFSGRRAIAARGPSRIGILTPRQCLMACNVACMTRGECQIVCGHPYGERRDAFRTCGVALPPALRSLDAPESPSDPEAGRVTTPNHRL